MESDYKRYNHIAIYVDKQKTARHPRLDGVTGSSLDTMRLRGRPEEGGSCDNERNSIIHVHRNAVASDPCCSVLDAKP